MYVFRYIWDHLKGSIWGRLTATILIASLFLARAFKKGDGPGYRFFVGFVVIAIAGELYLEFMSHRRVRDEEGRIQTTWGDVLVMILFLAVLVSLFLCFIVLP
jgi:nitrate reductase gamma subunit